MIDNSYNLVGGRRAIDNINCTYVDWRVLYKSMNNVRQKNEVTYYLTRFAYDYKQ